MQKKKSGVKKCLEICAIKGGGPTPNGKNHLKFPFWLFDNLPKCITWYNGDEEEIDINGIHLTGSDWLSSKNSCGGLEANWLDISFHVLHISILCIYQNIILFTDKFHPAFRVDKTSQEMKSYVNDP